MTAPGLWRVRGYGSGTINVEDGKERSTKFGVAGVGPHIGIGYSRLHRDLRDGVKDRFRYELAEYIAGLLNGDYSKRSRIIRTGEITGISDEGITFSAIGPSVDTDPPNCNWKEDDSEDARNARARLMDRVFGIGVPVES